MGLAAPQIGLNLRLMVFNVEGVRGKGEELVLVNPIIMSSGKALWTEEEGCLSFRQGRTAVLGSVTVRLRLLCRLRDGYLSSVACSSTPLARVRRSAWRECIDTVPGGVCQSMMEISRSTQRLECTPRPRCTPLAWS